MPVTKADIVAAIHSVTGNPTTGPLADATPGIADAIDALVNPKAAKEVRVVKAEETR